MALQDDYIGDDVPKNIKEIIQTKGVHRDILEVQYIKAVTRNLKYQTLINLFCIAFGAVFAFALNYYYGKDEKSTTSTIHNLIIEKTKLTTDFQTYRCETNYKLLELQNQVIKLEREVAK